MAAELGNKLDVHVDTTVPADQFYGFFKNNMPRFVQLFPRNIKIIQIQGGGGVRPGAVMLWKYDIGITGSPMTAKVRVQSIDDENRTLVLEALEGDVLKVYKSFKAKIQFNDVDTGASKVIWGLEYEKASENAPEPDSTLTLWSRWPKGLMLTFARLKSLR